MFTWNVPLPLIALLVSGLNVAQPGKRRRRNLEYLTVPERRSTLLSEFNRVTFTVYILRISINLIQKQASDRHRAQSGRTIGSCKHKDSAREFLDKHCIRGVTRFTVADALPERLTSLNHRSEPHP